MCVFGVDYLIHVNTSVRMTVLEIILGLCPAACLVRMRAMIVVFVRISVIISQFITRYHWLYQADYVWYIYHPTYRHQADSDFDVRFRAKRVFIGIRRLIRSGLLLCRDQNESTTKLCRHYITRMPCVRSRKALKEWLNPLIFNTHRVDAIVNAAMDQHLHSVAALAEVADIVVYVHACASL